MPLGVTLSDGNCRSEDTDVVAPHGRNEDPIYLGTRVFLHLAVRSCLEDLISPISSWSFCFHFWIQVDLSVYYSRWLL